MPEAVQRAELVPGTLLPNVLAQRRRQPPRALTDIVGLAQAGVPQVAWEVVDKPLVARDGSSRGNKAKGMGG